MDDVHFVITTTDTPMVEYAPVVRCKYCKYFAIAQLKSDYTEDKRYNPSVCINGKYAVPRKPDWFCADGKRKEQDDEQTI